MSELTTLARPYAKAAFEFAQSVNQLDNWSEMLSFCAAVISDEALAKFLDNPGLTRDEAAQAMLKITAFAQQMRLKKLSFAKVPTPSVASFLNL